MSEPIAPEKSGVAKPVEPIRAGDTVKSVKRPKLDLFLRGILSGAVLAVSALLYQLKPENPPANSVSSDNQTKSTLVTPNPQQANARDNLNVIAQEPQK